MKWQKCYEKDLSFAEGETKKKSKGNYFRQSSYPPNYICLVLWHLCNVIFFRFHAVLDFGLKYIINHNKNIRLQSGSKKRICFISSQNHKFKL